LCQKSNTLFLNNFTGNDHSERTENRVKSRSSRVISHGFPIRAETGLLKNIDFLLGTAIAM
jgi:hypothetical protein